MGKICFPQGKINFEHIKNSVQTAELLALGKAMNIYINCLMFYSSRQHVKWNHFKYTGLNSTMISWCWRFHVLSCWRFFPCHLSHRYVMKMYCPPVTILGYTSQNRHFEKFINIHSNKKNLKRSSITHFLKESQEVFYISCS